MYSSARHGSDVDLRNALENLFIKYSVDIACWGHDHFYQRTYPVYNSAPNISSVDWYSNLRGQLIHTVIGNAGRSLYEHTAFDPAWSAYRESQFGISYFNITYDGTLTWKYYRTANLTLRDEFTLVNSEYKGTYSRSLSTFEIILIVIGAVTILAIIIGVTIKVVFDRRAYWGRTLVPSIIILL